VYILTISYTLIGLFERFIIESYNGGAKRRHEPVGSKASFAGEMPTVFSDLLAPRESAHRQLFLDFTIAFDVNDHGANKELRN
jgi:hypothetical protein